MNRAAREKGGFESLMRVESAPMYIFFLIEFAFVQMHPESIQGAVLPNDNTAVSCSRKVSCPPRLLSYLLKNNVNASPDVIEEWQA